MNIRDKILGLADRDEQKVINKLLTIQALIDDVLDNLMPYNEEPICDHPIEARKDLSVMGCEHWICRKCGYEHKEESGG